MLFIDGTVFTGEYEKNAKNWHCLQEVEVDCKIVPVGDNLRITSMLQLDFGNPYRVMAKCRELCEIKPNEHIQEEVN